MNIKCIMLLMLSKLIPQLVFLAIGLVVTTGLAYIMNTNYVPSAQNMSNNSNTATSTNSTPVTQTPATTYTLAQVATHNTPQNCWTTINGEVYNLTLWIANHPGGEDAIISLCGIDGSGAFNGQHGDQPNPAKMLASFKIGTLK